jgi:hypothetical protein
MFQRKMCPSSSRETRTSLHLKMKARARAHTHTHTHRVQPYLSDPNRTEEQLYNRKHHTIWKNNEKNEGKYQFNVYVNLLLNQKYRYGGPQCLAMATQK